MERMRVWLVLALCVPILLADPPRSAAAGFGWPLRPRPAVLVSFDPPEHDWLSGHRGVDLAAASDQPVFAAADGTVVFAGDVAGKPAVSVDHANGLRTTYEPVRAVVRAGQRVSRGTQLGVVAAGHPGCPGTCLHWGARRGRDHYLDPLTLVRPTPVRLKPLAG